MTHTLSTHSACIAVLLLALGLSGCSNKSGGSSVETDDTLGDAAASDAPASDVPLDVMPGDAALDTASDSAADAPPTDQTLPDTAIPDQTDVGSDTASPDTEPEDTQPDVVLPPCAPGSTCTAFALPECISLVDNSGKAKAGLRMASFEPLKPAALASGLVKNLLQGAVLANLPSCNLQGSGTLGWLLEFEGTQLKTGGAKPVVDPTQGLTFVNEMISGIQVAPVVVPFGMVGDNFETQSADLVIPLFMDSAGTQAILLPLKGMVVSGKLSEDQNCIGTYNAEGLDPANNCVGDDTHPTFLAGGQLRAHITLEDADTIVVTPVSQTLCVLLGGAPDSSSPIKHCARDVNGKIVFQGDWCDPSNVADDCKDSVQLIADFAASGVLIL